MLDGDWSSDVCSSDLVKASPATLNQIARTLADIDIPRRNLRIQIQVGNSAQSLRQELGASGQYQGGSTRIIVTNGERRDGNISARDARGNRVYIGAERRITTRRDATDQTVVVLDGGRASLRIGESIPHVQPFLALVGDRLTVAAGIQYYDVTTGFEARPHVIGRQVQLRINPRLAFRTDQGMQTVTFAELQTEVMIPLGEWFDLGTILGNANAVSRRILGTDQSTDDARTSLRVRIDPM
jgi:type II secretory pathway component GspD/PulD (secretin)